MSENIYMRYIALEESADEIEEYIDKLYALLEEIDGFFDTQNFVAVCDEIYDLQDTYVDLLYQLRIALDLE